MLDPLVVIIIAFAIMFLAQQLIRGGRYRYDPMRNMPFIIIMIVTMIIFYPMIQNILFGGNNETIFDWLGMTEDFDETAVDIVYYDEPNESKTQIGPTAVVYRNESPIEPMPINYTLDIEDLTDTSLLDT